MVCGGTETSLEIYKNYLKKLLLIIDKLPRLKKEKAVIMLSSSQLI